MNDDYTFRPFQNFTLTLERETVIPNETTMKLPKIQLRYIQTQTEFEIYKSQGIPTKEIMYMAVRKLCDELLKNIEKE